MSILQSAISAGVSKLARDKTAGRGLISLGVGVIATRLATRSVPGAIAVGAAFLAKHLYDQSKEEDAQINTAKELVEANPKIAAEIAQDTPEAMTDEYDDIALAREIKARKIARGEPVPDGI